MPLRPCPNCDAAAPRFLEESSKEATVWYYRCAACGHVWSIQKQDGQTLTHVTPMPAELPPQEVAE